ncbi:MAG: hypothetical protein AAGG80_03985, partial [Pseudomonadota bacterium]
MSTTKQAKYANISISYIYLFASLLSLFLSWLWLSYDQPINIDGILYLRVAKTFLHHGFNAAAHTYSWPFFSIMIAYISKLSHLSLLTSAHLLVSFFYVLIVIGFMNLVKTMGGNKQTIVIAALVVLFFPTLAHERAFIYRDFGYYAFALFALAALIQYDRYNKTTHALLWGIYISIATLFRIEGVIFFLFAPLLLLFNSRLSWIEKIVIYCKANIILLIAAIIFVYLRKFGNTTSHSLTLMQLLSNVASVFSSTQIKLHSFIQVIKHNFNTFIGQNAKLILFGGMFAIFFMAFLATLTAVLALLALIFWLKIKFNFAAKTRKHIYAFIVLNLIILTAFLLQTFFLIPRYMMFLGLIILTIIPFGIENILNRWDILVNKTWQNILLKTLFVLVALNLLISSAVHIGADKSYIIKSGKWLNAHTSTKDRFYINAPRIAFYSQRQNANPYIYGASFSYQNLEKINSAQYDFYVLQVNHHNVQAAKN